MNIISHELETSMRQHLKLIMPIELVKHLYTKGTGAVLAGGAVLSGITGHEVKDIDFFFESRVQAEAFESFIKLIGYKPVMSTDNAETFEYAPSFGKAGWSRSLPVLQLCHKRGDLTQLLDWFDFTVAKVAIYEGKLHYVEEAPKDIKDRRLIYDSSNNPVGSLYRALRYSQKGYSLSKSELQDILFDIGVSNEDYVSERLGLEGNY